MNRAKVLLGATLAFGLVFGNSAAHAMGDSEIYLDYDSFTQSDNYIELIDLVDQSSSALVELDNIGLNVSSTSSVRGVKYSAKMEIVKNPNAVSISLSSKLAQTKVVTMGGTSYLSVDYACTQYFYEWSIPRDVGGGCPDSSYLNAVRKYLKLPKLKYVKYTESINEGYLQTLIGDDSITSDPEVLDITPYLDFEFQIRNFLKTLDSSLASYDGLSRALFSEITISQSKKFPGGTEYSFDISNSIQDRQVGITLIFDADSSLVQTKLDYTFESTNFSALTDINQKASSIKAPSATETVIKSKFNIANNYLVARQLVSDDIDALSATAGLMAKKAKKPLSVAHLTVAAKALKLPATAIKGGLKLTRKHLGTPASICVLLVKGKIQSKDC